MADPVKDTPVADGGWLKAQFDWLMGYLPKPWQKFAAVGIMAIIAWYFVGGLLSSFLPERDIPATVSDLSAKADMESTASKAEVALKAEKSDVDRRLETQSSSVAQVMEDVKVHSDELVEVKARLDAIEQRLTVRKRRPAVAAQ